MVDLSHWVFAKDFTAYEAAYLILGVDPSTDTDGRNSNHIIERMREAYAGAIHNLTFHVFSEPCLPEILVEDEADRIDFKLTLSSVEMERLTEAYFQGDEVSISTWLDRGQNEFSHQRFSRAKLAKWLNDNKLVSAYQFESIANPMPSEKSGIFTSEKPLGTRERDTLLTIIAALCKDANIDINTPSKAGDLISSMTDSIGAHVGKRTIEEHMKKIPDALRTRMK